MTNELIRTEIESASCEYAKYKSLSISDDKAFSYMLLSIFFGLKDFDDKFDCVTDGSHDGGIDFIYFDEEDTKLFICQAKYTNNLNYGEIRNELDKICDTINNFRKSNTGSYNETLKRILQNALDRLPDDDQDNIEIILFSVADIKDTDGLINKATNDIPDLEKFTVSIFAEDDIERRIQEVHSEIATVSSAKIEIDRAQNYLVYENEHARGVMVNVKSTSLITLYNRFKSSGLFDMNIRHYIRNRLVDDKINETLHKNRGDFWFLNNGIVIACEDFIVDGTKIALTNFSIVNGGQTTYLIGQYKGNNSEKFYIPCKIVAAKHQNSRHSEIPFPTKIAEATNSQKPISPRDLKSNSPEMLRLARMLKNYGIYLEVKRGVKKPRKFQAKYSIRNDILAQIILSMIAQIPGTAKQGIKRIFESARLYNSVFKVNYEKDINKKEFLIDVIQLYNRYIHIESELKKKGLTTDQVSVMKNGVQVTFAILGIIYRLANNDITEDELITDKSVVKSKDFVYGKFISNYSGDDLEVKLKQIIIDVVQIMTDAYRFAYQNSLATSVNYFFKSDIQYMDNVLRTFINILSSTIVWPEIKSLMDIFRRQ